MLNNPEEHTKQESVQRIASYLSIARDSIPVLLGVSMEVIMMTINLHYSTSSVMTAGLGLSMILIHTLGGSLIIGFNYGYINFASRAFGAKNQQLFNRYLAKGLFNLGWLLILFFSMGFASEWLSNMVGQDPEVSKNARDFYVYQLPGFFSLYFADFLRGYLNAQSIFNPLTYVNIATTIIHLVLSLFISSKYGMTGIIITTNISMIGQLLMTILVERWYSPWKFSFSHVRVDHLLDDYKPFTSECFYVAFPLVLDLFMFQMLAIFVGSFRIIQQTAAHIAFTNIAMIGGSLEVGISSTAMIKAGQFIGQNNVKAIKILAKRSFILVFGTIQLFFLLIFVFKQKVFQFYTSDPAVKLQMQSILFPYFVLNFFDAVQFIYSQMYKAFKMGEWICKVFIISYYVCGLISMVIISQFTDSKIASAWYGFAFGVFIIDCFYYNRHINMDLNEVVCKLHEEVRVKEEMQCELIEKIKL